jgi:hypothetical protein
MPNPCQHPPYHWGRHAEELGLDEPNYTLIPDPTATFDVLDVDACNLQQHWLLEGMWARMYPTDPAQWN